MGRHGGTGFLCKHTWKVRLAPHEQPGCESCTKLAFFWGPCHGTAAVLGEKSCFPRTSHFPALPSLPVAVAAFVPPSGCHKIPREVGKKKTIGTWEEKTPSRCEGPLPLAQEQRRWDTRPRRGIRQRLPRHRGGRNGIRSCVSLTPGRDPGGGVRLAPPARLTEPSC